jgi:DNA recombination protein RmuC
LRTHMKQLADKKYWEALLPLTPDYVVMFIPGENFYAAAVERDPQLFEDAVAARVLIVTPTTMIALAKAIAAGWRQEKMAEHALQVAELGRDLYKRLATMGGHIAQVGSGLGRAVEHYNKFVGSLESSVMPQARRFNELAVEGTHEALPELRPVEIEPRQLVGRDVPLAAVEPRRSAAEQPQAAD